jgi:hypothetical protein
LNRRAALFHDPVEFKFEKVAGLRLAMHIDQEFDRQLEQPKERVTALPLSQVRFEPDGPIDSLAVDVILYRLPD